VREYLAREDVTHRFVDVRKAPISAAETVKIVRKHRRAIAKMGGKLRELDPKKATDEEIEKLFLGREGTMRAPVVSTKGTIFAGFDEETIAALVRG
jgi:arsenate reductase-like glutaredoxin family protein